MKQINVGSDWKFGFYLLDVNGRTIDPSTVNVSVRLFTDGQTYVTFSAINGVYTGCKSVNSALMIAVKNPDINKGILRAEVTLRIPDAEFADGVDESVDVKNLDIEIVDSRTSIFNDQGVKFTAVVLTKILCTDATQGNMVPAGLTEQYVKDIINKELSDANIASKVATAGFVKKDLSTVDKQTILDKGIAASDLSNVNAVKNAKDGAMFYKKSGALVEAPVSIDDTNKKLKSKYSLEVPPNSVGFGLNTSLHENGGFLEYRTNSLGKNYILLDYENDPVNGSSKPIYYKRGALEQKVPIQPDYSKTIANVQEVDLGNPTFDRQVDAIYIRFASPVQGLKMMVNINGKDVADYPSGSWDDDTVAGFSFSAGEQKIPLSPSFTGLIEYDVKFRLKAAAPIDLLGSDTLPYIAYDLHRVSRVTMATMEDVGAGGGNLASKANKDLSNVDDDVFTQKGIQSGLLQQDLEDIVLVKLNEKFGATDSGKQLSKNTGEIDRLKTVISPQPQDIFTYRGSSMPPIDAKLYKAYYISLFNLPRSGQTLNLPITPTPLVDGTVFCVDNNDLSDTVIIKPRVGETVNTGSQLILNPDSVAFLVKKGTDWAIAFNGLLPASLGRLITDIQVALPNELNTIDEIQAALKDRLHTYREIQTEFADQLHTLDGIEKEMVNRGFSKTGSLTYGLSDQPNPPQNNAWIIGHMSPNEEIIIPAPAGGGTKYLILVVPTDLETVVQSLQVNGKDEPTTGSDYVQNELKYRMLITSQKIDASTNIRLSVSYGFGSLNGIMIDDGLTQAAGVKKIMLQNAKIGTYQDDPSKIDITSQLVLKQETGNDLKATSLLVQKPLNLTPNPSVVGEVVMNIEPNAYEEMQDDSYLAYMSYDTPLMPDKMVNGQYTHDTIWFDDVQKEAGNFIGIDWNEKSFMIQESDTLDPNLSNGEKYLVCCYLDFKSVAKSDCFINFFLKLKDSTEYVTDANGNPCFVSKVFKTGDAFGFLGMNNLIIAKGQQNIQVCISHNNSENIVIKGMENGVSGLLVQQMKTGTISAAKMQYEGDTDSSIRVSKLAMTTLGDMALKLRTDSPEQTFAAKYYQNDSDGFYMIAHSSLKSRRENGQLIITNDGNNKTFFELGWEIDEVRARALRGKSIHTEHIITVPLNDMTLGMYEWRGTGNPTAPVLQWNKTTNTITTSAGWNEVLDSDITHSPDKQEDTTTFNIPANANRFMLIMYPTVPSEPFEMRLQKFSVVVDVPFIDYVVKGAESTKENHLEYDKSYAKFKMMFNPVQGLRYTINKGDTKMPVGTKTIGMAPVTLTKAWTDSGFDGEGALEFAEDGKATITTKLKMTVGENVPQGATENIEFWYAKILSDKTFFKIAESSTVFALQKEGAYPKQYTMNTFTYDAKKDDVLWLFAKSTTVDDGAYLVILIGERGPMVDTDIYFTSLTTFQNDPATNEVEFIQDGHEVFNKRLSYDINTGKFTIKDIQ